MFGCLEPRSSEGKAADMPNPQPKGSRGHRVGVWSIDSSGGGGTMTRLLVVAARWGGRVVTCWRLGRWCAALLVVVASGAARWPGAN